jgi:hypothetical protein
MKYSKQEVTTIGISALLVFALSFLYSDISIERRLLICVLFGAILFIGKNFSNKWLKRKTIKGNDFIDTANKNHNML